MKRFISYIIPFVIFAACSAVQAASVKRTNFVVFNIKGDCAQEDCIAAVKDVLQPFSDTIAIIDASSLASRQTTDYKAVIITFKSLSNAPYEEVMSGIATLGYSVVSYVIHDTHTGQDVIIPH